MYSNYLCQTYVLNNINDSLYNEYYKEKIAQGLRKSLYQKYQIENASVKKFVVGCCLEYHMVDSKQMTIQMREIQDILTEIHDEGMIISETFQIIAIIEKLSISWKEFKFYFKRKQNGVNLKDLIIRFKVEEDNRTFTKRGYTSVGPKANIVKYGQHFKNNNLNKSK